MGAAGAGGRTGAGLGTACETWRITAVGGNGAVRGAIQLGGGRAAIVAAAAIACASCARPAPQPERLVLAVATLPDAALVHLALANGDFAREGLALTVVRTPYGKLALDLLLAGKADVATCAETPVVFAALKGQPVAVIAAVSASPDSTAVLARRDAGVARPADLAGRRVGVPRGTSAEFFLEVLLVRNLVDPGAVGVVDLPPEDLADALDAGRVDAVAIWNPVLRSLRHRFGDRVVALSAPDVYRQTFEVVVRPELLRERPAAVERLLRGLLAAEAFQRRHPDEARRIVAEALALAPEDAAPVLGAFDHRTWLDQGLVVQMEQEARWAVRAGLAPAEAAPNFLEIVQPAPLLAVKPEVVRLHR